MKLRLDSLLHLLYGHVETGHSETKRKHTKLLRYIRQLSKLMCAICPRGEDMFDPSEWTRKPSTNEDTRMIYINKDTLLPKLRETFSREQQRMLDRHEIRLYEMRKKQ